MLACPECKSTNLRKYGTKWVQEAVNNSPQTVRRVKKQQYQCKHCGRITVHPLTPPTRNDKGRFAKAKSQSATASTEIPT